MEYPEGTGNILRWEEDFIHHQGTLSGAWFSRNMFLHGDQVSAGLHLSFNQLAYYSEIGKLELESFPAGYSWAAGIQYRVSFNNQFRARTGLFL
ncbi:MAG: hypothetical protein L6Q77_01120 [Bacteroidetes bacterium]|nr:hypothetical protein [Bacteroidota bacterium]